MTHPAARPWAETRERRLESKVAITVPLRNGSRTGVPADTHSVLKIP